MSLFHVDLERHLRRTKIGRPLNIQRYGNGQPALYASEGTHYQVKVQAYINGSAQDAYLQQQKNGNTFHVVDASTGTHTALCKFVNSASPVAGQMSCQATTNALSTFYISRITNRYVYDFSATPVKYFWDIPTIKPDAAITDYPNILHVSLPSAVKASSPNLAP